MATNAQIQRFIQLSESLNSRMSRPAAEEWADIDLTMGQLRTLLFLADGPRRMSEIATSLGSSLSSSTSMIERLLGRGLVKRRYDEADRRVVLCELTSRGREDLEQFWRIRESRLKELAALLTTEEFDVVISALQVVSDALQRHQSASAPSAEAV